MSTLRAFVTHRTMRQLRMQVTWGNGATIGGSSGSPLIDTTTQKIVGVLTGGYTSCQDRTKSDYYGRLSAVRLLYCPSMRSFQLAAWVEVLGLLKGVTFLVLPVDIKAKCACRSGQIYVWTLHGLHCMSKT